MKITVTESMFKDAFVRMNRADNFSSAGLSALFEFLEDMEKDIGEEYELDVIALCCDFSEEHYSSIASDYGIDGDFDTLLEYLEGETLVIHADEDTGKILYRNF